MYKIRDNLSEERLKEERKEQNSRIYILLLLLFMLVVIFLDSNVFLSIQVKGNSMNLTLNNQDMLVANKYKTPRYGDIVILNCKAINGWIIKRVVALGGDTVRIKGGSVYLTREGQREVKLSETYTKGITYANNQTKRIDEEKIWVIPEGKMFVMGDNRENSSDSRYFGLFGMKDLMGVVEPWSVRTKSVRNFLFKIVGASSCVSSGG